MSAGIPGQPDGPPSGYTGYGGRADHRNRPSRGSIRLARPRARLATTWPGSPGCHRLRRPMARRSDAATVTWQDHPGALWAAACGGLWGLVLGLVAACGRACRRACGGTRLAGRAWAVRRRGLRAGVGGLSAGACGRVWAACRRGLRGLAGGAYGRFAGGVVGGLRGGFAKDLQRASGRLPESRAKDCRKTAGRLPVREIAGAGARCLGLTATTCMQSNADRLNFGYRYPVLVHQAHTNVESRVLDALPALGGLLT
jgi:hypothetical protein